MDGVSEDFDDFSGLPERKDRDTKRAERFAEHRANPHRGRMWRIALVGGFAIGLMLIAVSLIVAFAPAPYLGVNSSALAKSIGSEGAGGCHPGTGGWVCSSGEGAAAANYRVKSDWSGCWTGQRIGGAAGSGQPAKISGCVTVMDHLTAK